MVVKNHVYELDIVAVSNEASGIGHVNDFVVFVPFTAAGDRVQVRIVKVMKRYAYGIIESIIRPSPERIQVDCPVYGKCGGCSFRHISYEEELRLKYAFVRDALQRIGKIDVIPEEIFGCGAVRKYRNKAQYPIGVTTGGRAVGGFFAKRSHRIVESDHCCLQPDIFSDILDTVLQWINQYKISVYDEKLHTGLIRTIYLRTGEKTKEVMVCIVSTTGEIPCIDILTEALVHNFQDIKSIVVNVNAHKTNVILGEKNNCLYGSETITDQLCGVTFQLSPHSFYQVNHRQTEKLYGLVKELAGDLNGKTVLDLYCGVGTIGLTLAKDAQKIIGIEIVEQAVQNAQVNAERNGFHNAEFYCCDAKEGVRKLLKNHLAPDIVIVDPPRKGCDETVLQAIQSMEPSRVVMVSCNPSTMARDCRHLTDCGYTVRKVYPVDMFPRTNHVETVVLLSIE